MGEHKDDEKDLDACSPIASLSLGQPRDFYFKHQDCRGSTGSKQRKNHKSAKTTKLKDSDKALSMEVQGSKEKVTLVLESGSLLMMHPPTNNYWYHALPKRKNATGTRINLTFRCMKSKITKWMYVTGVNKFKTECTTVEMMTAIEQTCVCVCVLLTS